MALISCKECKKEISDKATICPHCGYNLSITNEKPQKDKKLNVKKLVILACSIIAIAIIVSLIVYNAQPSTKYNRGLKAFENNDYDKAIKYFEAAGDYEDAPDKLNEATEASSYYEASDLMDSGDYVNAIEKYNESNGYSDSNSKIIECYFLLGEECSSNDKYTEALEYYNLALEYEKTHDRLIELGESLTIAGDYNDAAIAFDYAGEKDNKYLYYCKAQANYKKQNYINSIQNFKKAGDLLDSQEMLTAVKYDYACDLKSDKKYADAIELFSELDDYNNSYDLLLECIFCQAQYYYEYGYLNLALEAFQSLPEDYSYNDVSSTDYINKLSSLSNYLQICGEWKTSGGQMRSTQSGSYKDYYWYRDFDNSDDYSVYVDCSPQDDGSIRIHAFGIFPVYTNYSSFSEYLDTDLLCFEIDEITSIPATFKTDEYTTVTINKDSISVKYKKTDNTQDVYFTYVYTTNMTFGKKIENY